VDLSTKLGAPLAKDVDSLRRNLSSLVGGSGSGSSASSWRSTPAAAPAAAAPAGDRWSKYSAGATQSASWRRSGSHNASGSKLSTSDLAHLRLDDLSDLVRKTGAEVPRDRTKDTVIGALVSKGVSLNDLTRGKYCFGCSLKHQTVHNTMIDSFGAWHRLWLSLPHVPTWQHNPQKQQYLTFLFQLPFTNLRASNQHH